MTAKLGVTLDADGAHVAVVSANATGVTFCRFDADGRETRTPLTERTGDVWHGQVTGVIAGTRYGLRTDGPWQPERGHRFDVAKLLLDPYAHALDGTFRLDPTMLERGADSAPFMPKAIAGPPPALAQVPHLEVPWSRTVLYELHVRGFTMRHPDIPPALRGTFAALAHPAALAHLTALGVTTVELMPTATWIDERHLVALGLSNYWGYNSVAFMAPDPRLAPGGWAEVRLAVAALAAAGIETVLDVVLNHTGEGDAHGPTLSQRGLDNALYYRLAADGGYVDDTGCGNTLALDRPHVARLAMDALRAWALWGGVHGFRFDLATTLGRRDGGFDAAAPLLTAIGQDPALSRLKLIAEPWDVGWGGYRLGEFPGGWGEWNDRCRDDMRRFWRGDADMAGALATRLAGSDDMLRRHRRPSRGINFVVAHDGFTLADMVAFTAKRNDANGEGNRDGSDANNSWNNGVEGPSGDPAVVAARRRDQVALLATLLLARGTPMLAMGSELGHSQHGNNNAYAQDNALAWLDWEAADTELLAATTRLLRLRATHPALREDRFLTGDGDVQWRRPDGAAMGDGDWQLADTLVCVLTTGDERVTLALHRGPEPVAVTLPEPRAGRSWQRGFGAEPVAARSVSVWSETVA